MACEIVQYISTNGQSLHSLASEIVQYISTNGQSHGTDGLNEAVVLEEQPSAAAQDDPLQDNAKQLSPPATASASLEPSAGILNAQQPSLSVPMAALQT